VVKRQLISLAIALTLILVPFRVVVSHPRTAQNCRVAKDDSWDQRCVEELINPSWPANLSAPDELTSFLRLMLKRSDTFRRQWRQLSLARELRLKIVYTYPQPDCRCRALSIAKKRSSSNTIEFTVHLFPPRVRDPEVIAHEFEHALEQAEGLDLKSLADSEQGGVYLLENGIFETKRARLVGVKVAREFRLSG